MSVRVRYAPSPTGLQHIGSIRTALFTYFFARSEGGTFILRIEDTDRERYHDEALKDLYETFKWLGISWDEGPTVGGAFGPYVQSERTELYRKYARELVAKGAAYYCYCTPERLNEMRIHQEKHKLPQGYDRRCRDLTDAQIEEYKTQGIPPVIRLKVPEEGKTSFDDFLLGTVTRKNKDINPDPVLLKSDGFPTYHLANVVDDHLMKITHILRAQEWLPSGSLHILLYKAFGWDPPVYCHLPMVMGKDGKKLSKRHGATAVREFREGGYLPEAVINYVSLVGWSYDDSREFFTKEELEKLFDLKKINKAPGIFDYKKLEWFNGQYIRMKTDEELKVLLLPHLLKAGFVSDPPTKEEEEILSGLIPLVKERLRTISGIADLVRFIFEEINEYNPEEAVPKRLSLEQTIEVLENSRGLLDGFAERNDEENEEFFRQKAEEIGVKLGDLLMPIRIAVTGSKASPPLFGSIRLIGIEKTLSRINRLIETLRGGK